MNFDKYDCDKHIFKSYSNIHACNFAQTIANTYYTDVLFKSVEYKTLARNFKIIWQSSEITINDFNAFMTDLMSDNLYCGAVANICFNEKQRHGC